jgi:diguanylate cyclase (GGDEF)-like protein
MSPNESTVALIVCVITVLGLCVHNFVLRRRVRRLRFDQTGLLVRQEFKVQAKSRIRHCGTVVAFLDLDRFKLINSLYGYDLGDAVLALIAERLRIALGPRALIGHYGGDEFVALIPVGAPGSAWSMIFERLAAVIAEPIDIRVLARLVGAELEPGVEFTVSVGVSIGAVHLAGVDKPVLSGVLGVAEKLMVTAKRRGGGTEALVAQPDDARLTRPAKRRPQVRYRDLRAALDGQLRQPARLRRRQGQATERVAQQPKSQ